jgi:Flp pilus assembly protein TadD
MDYGTVHHRLLVAALALGLAGCASSAAEDSAALSRDQQAVEGAARAAAEIAESHYDYQAAAASWARVYALHPKDASLVQHMARDLRYGGQVQAAIDAINAHTAREGPSPALLAELGKDFLAADRLVPAAQTLRQAADQTPGDWSVQSALGVALSHQGNYAAAQDAFHKALALSPGNPAVLNNLGLSEAEAGQLREAIATLQQAADQPTATVQVRQNLALLKAFGGDAKAAERIARQDLSSEEARANAAYYRTVAGAASLP